MPQKKNNSEQTENPNERTEQSERPNWLPEGYDAPEKFAEEANSWRERATKAEEFEKKYGSFDTFQDRLTAAEAKLREAIKAEYEGKQTKQPVNQTDDQFADWETIPPSEQARRLQAMTVSQLQSHLDETVGNYWKQAQDKLTKGLTDNSNQLNLLIKGFEMSRQTGIPVEQIWPQLEQLATAPTDQLMKIALERLQNPATTEKKIQEAVAAAKSQWDTEQKNRERANIAATQPASYRELHKGAERDANGRVTRNSIREAVLTKYANGEIPRG